MTLHVISCIKTFPQDQVKKVFITFFSCKIPCDQLLMLVYQKIDARGRWVGGGGIWEEKELGSFSFSPHLKNFTIVTFVQIIRLF